MTNISSLQIGQNKIEIPKTGISFENRETLQWTSNNHNDGDFIFYCENVPYDGFLLWAVHNQSADMMNYQKTDLIWKCAVRLGIAEHNSSSYCNIQTQLPNYYGNAISTYVKKGQNIRGIISRLGAQTLDVNVLYLFH